MRITDDRYDQHRRSLDLAWRMISHEARTHTISRWTQLSGHRIRALYKSYSSDSNNTVTRHRGMSPYQLDVILASPRLKCEASILSAICKLLSVIPPGRLDDVERTLPSIERGELLCEAFEWFRTSVPNAKLNFEQGILVLNELALHEQIELTYCRSCLGVLLMDRLSIDGPNCTFCSAGPAPHLKGVQSLDAPM